MVMELLEGWMIQNPKESIIIVAFLVTLVTTVLTKYVTDQKRIKELREKVKAKNVLFKEARKANDMEKMKKIQSEMMEDNMELIRHSFKPIFYTAVPFLVLFIWIKKIYDPVLSTWIWWYIGAGIASSLVLRKALNVA